MTMTNPIKKLVLPLSTVLIPSFKLTSGFQPQMDLAIRNIPAGNILPPLPLSLRMENI